MLSPKQSRKSLGTEDLAQPVPPHRESLIHQAQSEEWREALEQKKSM